jgi:ankyrin repeat protein
MGHSHTQVPKYNESDVLNHEFLSTNQNVNVAKNDIFARCDDLTNSLDAGTAARVAGCAHAMRSILLPALLLAAANLFGPAAGGGISGLEVEGHTDTIFDVVRRNNPQQILDLLEAGADVHSTSPDGKTSLMYAAQWGQGKDLAVPILLEAGSNIDQVDTFGMSAVMLAAQYGNANVLQLLIDAGADITIKVATGGWTGKTALDIAKERKRDDCAQILEAALAAKQKSEL